MVNFLTSDRLNTTYNTTVFYFHMQTIPDGNCSSTYWYTTWYQRPSSTCSSLYTFHIRHPTSGDWYIGITGTRNVEPQPNDGQGHSFQFTLQPC